MANPFDELLNDKVFIVNSDGERSGPYKTAISNNGEATIFDETLDVEEGYKLMRPLPNGKDDVFTILEANYRPEFHGIPPHYSLKTRKDSSLLHEQAGRRPTTINISNSQGIQVGDHCVQNIKNGLGELIQQIENTNSSFEQKRAAKELIRELISNPAVAGILGGATSGLLGLL